MQFSSRSNEFDRRNDEYKSKIYNTKTEKSDLNQKYSQKDEYHEKYSQKNHNQKNMSINFAEYDDQKNELYYEEIATNSKKKYEIFVEFVKIEVSCIKCKKIFSFKNKLHKHLKEDCKSIESTTTTREKFVKSIDTSDSKTSDSKTSTIVKFTTFTSNKSYDLTFRK